MKALLKIARPLSVSAILLLAGCGRSWFLASYERDISSSTRAIESARDDAHRAAAYTSRGDAYAEKARYSRAFNLISLDEYTRLFGLAIQDHDQAIALDPANAEAYFRRGEAYYSRAFLETVVNGNLVGTEAERKTSYAPAIADFRSAVEKDARHSRAWDSLGLSHENIGELDDAINAYSQEMALDPLGKTRLADAYCARGSANGTKKQYDAAIADYEKSIAMGARPDGCSCDPYNPLLVLYQRDRQYGQVWDVVNRARKAGQWIAPDFLEILKKESGRSN